MSKCCLEVHSVPAVERIAVNLLLLVNEQEEWCKHAAQALEIPAPQFQNHSFQSRSFHPAATKSFVWLIHAEPEKEWEKKSHRLAKQILQKYIYCQELDDDSVSALLSIRETCAYTLKALEHSSPWNSPRVLIPKTMTVLVNLLQPENSRHRGTPGSLQALLILSLLLLRFPENRPDFLSIPYSMERLVAFLDDNINEHAEVIAAFALSTLAWDAENRIKSGQFPNAMERLVALLAYNVSEDAQQAAAGVLGNLALGAEYRRKIGQFPNAMERLVALLADNVSKNAQVNAAFALATLALHAENNINIGQVPNALERLVALLANNVIEDAQQIAACALGNLAVDAENRKKIGQLPNAIERLVVLLADNVSELAHQNTALSLRNLALDAENRIKIGQFPNAIVRLVALLAVNVSLNHTQGYAGDTLRFLSLNVHAGDYEGALGAYEDGRVANDPRYCHLLA